MTVWRKSSRSGHENCMELSWQKSSKSGAPSNCLEMTWRKSSKSATKSGCVELGSTGLVRDSKNPSGPRLATDIPALVGWVRGNR